MYDCAHSLCPLCPKSMYFCSVLYIKNAEMSTKSTYNRYAIQALSQLSYSPEMLINKGLSDMSGFELCPPTVPYFLATFKDVTKIENKSVFQNLKSDHLLPAVIVSPMVMLQAHTLEEINLYKHQYKLTRFFSLNKYLSTNQIKRSNTIMVRTKTKSVEVVKPVKEQTRLNNKLELNDDNFQKIKRIADYYGCTCEEAINILLNSVTIYRKQVLHFDMK